MTPDNVLPIYVITRRPRDFPAHYVVRKQVIHRGNPEVEVTDWFQISLTLEGARELVPPGLYRMPASPIDNPVVVEWWL